MTGRRLKATASLAFSTVFVATMLTTLAPRQAASACLAGTAPFLSGQAGIFVNHAPIELPHSVVVQQTNTAGYSPKEICTYFNVLKKTPTQFQVQHKTCDEGKPLELDYNVSLDWIACN